jgi:hypothetical protein
MGAAVCEEIPAAKELFDRASSILGYDLQRVCKEGPKEVLDSTVNDKPGATNRSDDRFDLSLLLPLCNQTTGSVPASDIRIIDGGGRETDAGA